MPCTTVTMGRHNRTLITNALNAADGAGLRDGALLDDIEWRAVLAALGPQRLLSSLAARASSVVPVVSTLDLPKGHHTLDDALTYLRLTLAKLKVGQGRRGHARACDQQARVELPLGNGLSTFIGYDTDYLAVFTFNSTACGAEGTRPHCCASPCFRLRWAAAPSKRPRSRAACFRGASPTAPCSPTAGTRICEPDGPRHRRAGRAGRRADAPAAVERDARDQPGRPRARA